ncbi:MAG: LPS export ABC transporter periplasmic protein LptC, partial [Stellaceae bacterium]
MRARAQHIFAPRPIAPASAQVRRYSRFVYLTKLALPATAVALLLLVAAWPQIDASFVPVRFAIPRIDRSEARDLHMVKARYSGIDRDNRPFVVTAAVARQKPKLDGLVTLEQPKGDLTTASGSWVELSADTGFYQPQPKLLDLYGNVALYQDKGDEFHSTSAHVDMAAGTAVGDAPISGQGPFGHVTAQGFRILDHGDTIVFT